MITIMAAQIFIQAGVLCLLLYLIAKHEADYSFTKVAMVTAGIMAGTLLLDALLSERLGWFSILPQLGFIAFMIMTFCWISFWKSIVVVLIFSALHVALALGVAAIDRKMNETVDSAMPVQKEDYEMAKEFMEEVFGGPMTAEEQVPAAPRVPSAPPVPVPVAASPQPQGGPEVSRPVPRTETRREQPARTPSGPWIKAKRKLVLSGTMREGSGKYVAIVNGEMVEEGSTVSVRYKGNDYSWRVKAIGRDFIDYEPVTDPGPGP